MKKRWTDALRRTVATILFKDKYQRPVKGEVFMRLWDPTTGQLLDRNGNPILGQTVDPMNLSGSPCTVHIPNIIVRDAGVLIARLMKNNSEPYHGVYALAVGTGDAGWDPMNPPVATYTQRSLVAELSRKTFSSTDFIWPADGTTPGGVANVPTNIVDFTTIFGTGEAVGPLVEMGLVGGNCSDSVLSPNPVPAGAYDPTVDLSAGGTGDIDTLVNALNYPVINKPAPANLGLTWRLTF